MIVRTQSRESFSSASNRLSGQPDPMLRDGEHQDRVRLPLSLACTFNGCLQADSPAAPCRLFSRWYDPDVIGHQTFFAIPHPTLIGNYSRRGRSESGMSQPATNVRTEEFILPPRHRGHRDHREEDRIP